MENIEGFYKQTITVKGKPVERLVSKYDKNIVIAPNTSDADKSKLINLSNKKAEQGFTSLKIAYGSDTLQSPTNKWMVQEDGYLYKLPETPKGMPEKKKDALIGRINVIDGELVYARYGDNIVKFIKTGKNAPFNFVNVEETKSVPYHLYVIKNKEAYGRDNPNLVSWAENVGKGIITNPPIASIAFKTDKKSSFTSNIGMDLGFDGESNFISASMLDFSGGNSNLLDSDIVSKFSGNHVSMNRRRRVKEESSFTGGAMPDFNGGSDSDFCGDSNFSSNIGLDLGVDGSSTPSDIKKLTVNDIKSFQSWYNKNKGGKLVVDGKWGAKTNAAWSASKNDWAKTKHNVPKPSTPTASKPVVTADATDAAKNKVVYTEAEMKALYAKSGSRKPFAEWAKSDGAKNLLGSAKDVALAILAARAARGSSGAGSISNDGTTTTTTTDNEKTILGMHPVTFGIVATVVAVAAIGGIIWYTKHSAAKKIIPIPTK
jgi:hypothetical protein